VRHRPEQTVLHQTLSAHFEQFAERAEEAGGLPDFVLLEVREYLRCGLPMSAAAGTTRSVR
jgi:hypothetical protein